MSQKIANTLLPFSYALWAQEHHLPIQLYSRKQLTQFSTSLTTGHYNTEVSVKNEVFVNSPPHDVHICVSDSEHHYYESKVVLYKGAKTELILRQDCYAFNCLQHLFMRNAGRSYASLADVLADETIEETPYLWLLIWNDSEDIVTFDCVVFTDIAVLQMIQDAQTSRSKEAIALIDQALTEHATHGTITYKKDKSSTVPHQKVSLFPLRDLAELKQRTFDVRATQLVLQTIRPDKNIWQDIEKSKLQERIRALEAQLEQMQVHATDQVGLPTVCVTNDDKNDP